MKEGYWANYEQQTVFLIEEHEQWIRREGNADKLGVASAAFKMAAAKYVSFKDRDAFLVHLMAQAPIMRVRGHVETVTFEFHALNTVAPVRMIKKLGAEWFGPHSVINVFNFATSANWQGGWMEFELGVCELEGN